jgi:translation elongation factor EF-Tu-like GTPase
LRAGRIEAGIVKPGDEVEIVGIKPGTKTSVTGTICSEHLVYSFA